MLRQTLLALAGTESRARAQALKSLTSMIEADSAILTYVSTELTHSSSCGSLSLSCHTIALIVVWSLSIFLSYYHTHIVVAV